MEYLYADAKVVVFITKIGLVAYSLVGVMGSILFCLKLLSNLMPSSIEDKDRESGSRDIPRGSIPLPGNKII